MRKYLVGSFAALAVAMASQQTASAWCDFSFGAGIGLKYSHGGDSSFLWGACQHWDYPHTESFHRSTLPFNEHEANYSYGPPPAPSPMYYGYGIDGAAFDPGHGAMPAPAYQPAPAYPSAPASPTWQGPTPSVAPSAYYPSYGGNTWPVGYYGNGGYWYGN